MRRAVGQACALLVGYGCGSVMVADRVARRHGVDLRRDGGNPGAWNALEQLGARRAWPAFVGDGAKAAAPALGARAAGGWWSGWAALAGAMLGHAFPLGRPREGGKSVMCFAGGMIALAPGPWLGCLALTILVSRRWGFARGARAGVAALPLGQLLV